MNKFREKIYNWIKNLSERAKVFWLSLISFSESSFFPIPPDPFLMVYVFANPRNWIKYSTLVSVFSVLGGLFGYVIGFFFFDFFGQWLINTYSLVDEFETVRVLFSENAFWSVFVSAFTPIPYKIFTIASGFFVINIFSFLIASILGRSIRFFIVGFVSYLFGKRFANIFVKYFDLIAIIVVLAVVFYLLV